MRDQKKRQDLLGLIELLDEMRKTNIPFNAVIKEGKLEGDVSELRLLDNGIEWSAVCETGKYDIWEDDDLVHTHLPLQEAAKLMVNKYQTTKIIKVANRLIKGGR